MNDRFKPHIRSLVAHVNQLSRSNPTVTAVAIGSDCQRIQDICLHTVIEEVVPMEAGSHIGIRND